MMRPSLTFPILCLSFLIPAQADDLPGDGSPASVLPAPSAAAAIIRVPPPAPMVTSQETGIRWNSVVSQAGLLFAISQGYRLAAQSDTRQALKGPYLKDYFESLKGLGGWGDDDPPIANYVAHPIQGSVSTWILVHNDPKGAPLAFEMSKPYWVSRFKGMGFSAAFSTFYELSPVGDAAVGNLGMRRDYKGMVDLVITPTLGLGWHVTEDMLDRYFIQWVETKTGNFVINALVRTWLNPTRGFANILRFKRPWERDSRKGLRYIHEQHRSHGVAITSGD